MRKRKKMESGDIPSQKNNIERREYELYQRWERIVNASFARYDQTIHPDYPNRRIIRLLFFTGYFVMFYSCLMYILGTITTTTPNESAEEKKPVRGTGIITHYDEWNYRRLEYFKQKDKCTEFPSKVK